MDRHKIVKTWLFLYKTQNENYNSWRPKPLNTQVQIWITSTGNGRNLGKNRAFTNVIIIKTNERKKKRIQLRLFHVVVTHQVKDDLMFPSSLSQCFVS